MKLRTVSIRCIACIFCTVLLSEASENQASPEAEAIEEAAPGTNATMQTVKDLYNKARSLGEDVPRDALEWARQDIKRMGAWEYRVMDINEKDPDALTLALNELGEDRWECFWVEHSRRSVRFYFKKSSRSYLKAVPVGDLFKLIPGKSDE